MVGFVRLVRITTNYRSYLQQFYAKHPELGEQSFAVQYQALAADCFGWADFWSYALRPIGYEVFEIVLNNEILQKMWAAENNINEGDMGEIVISQMKMFKPDILWYDHCDEILLDQILSETKSLKLILGWTGSAIPKTKIWNRINVVLTCAPEAVQQLKKMGIESEHIHHGFDHRILNKLKSSPKRIDFSFTGSISLGEDYHNNRYEILKQLSDSLNLEIYTGSIVKENFSLKKFLFSRSDAKTKMAKKFRKSLRNEVFGLEMLQMIHDSKIGLNIHADSSTKYASNMRMFEITGVGTCLLTEMRENIGELFEPDKEIVTYTSVGECVEKAKWLLNNPAVREQIAKEGQKRTLQFHTYLKRAERLDEIIKKYI